MSQNEFDVIVIGSGPGGCATASLLQKRGVKTLMLEKNGQLGGKMFSVDKDGYAYDLFPHGQVPIHGNAFETIFQELGVYDEYQPALSADDPRDVITIAYRRHDWKEYRVASNKQAMDNPEPFLRIWEATPEEQVEMMTVMGELISMDTATRLSLSKTSMHDWLMSKGVSKTSPLYSYMAFQANASLAEPIDLVAASEQILLMQQFMLHGGGGQYKGGFGHLSTVMGREFEKLGGVLMKNTRVEKILIENGAAAGVVTSKGTFRAPVVVSTAGIQPTILKLAGEEHFDKSYTNYIKGLIPGWGFTSIRYFLNKPVMKTGMYIMYSDDSYVDTERYKKIKDGTPPEEVILFMCNHSFYDEHAAPPGKQVLVSGTVCTANPDAREIEWLFKCMDNQMQKYFPDIWAAVERKEYNGPKEVSNLTRDSVIPGHGGECVGIAQIVGQCGPEKPKSETPVRGLYIAGADAGAEGMGTHLSALSGMGVAKMAQEYLLKRKRV